METAFVTVKVKHTSSMGTGDVHADWPDNLADAATKALEEWKAENPDAEIDLVQLVSSHYTAGVLVINYLL